MWLRCCWGGLVVIIAEVEGKKIGRIRLKQVLNASAESLEDAIKQALEPGSLFGLMGGTATIA